MDSFRSRASRLARHEARRPAVRSPDNRWRPLDRVLDREIHVGVGAESETHQRGFAKSGGERVVNSASQSSKRTSRRRRVRTQSPAFGGGCRQAGAVRCRSGEDVGRPLHQNAGPFSQQVRRWRFQRYQHAAAFPLAPGPPRGGSQREKLGFALGRLYPGNYRTKPGFETAAMLASSISHAAVGSGMPIGSRPPLPAVP